MVGGNLVDLEEVSLYMTRPRHIAFSGTPWVPASPPRTHETVYYGITDVIQTVTHIKICNIVYITCIQISWRVLGQGSKPNPRFWRGLYMTLCELHWGRKTSMSAPKGSWDLCATYMLCQSSKMFCWLTHPKTCDLA